MYERFTDHSRKVMQLANQAAQRMNHDCIGTEHILLGLIDQGDGVGVNVLKKLGIDLRDLRLEVEKLVQRGTGVVTMGKLPQTPRGKKVIEYAMEEARTFGHNYVGTEHILLGLLREREGVAGQVLMNRRVELESLRAEILRLLGGAPSPPASQSRHNTAGVAQEKLPGTADSASRTGRRGSMYELFTDRARKVMQLANLEAQRFNHEYIGTEHVLLGLVKEGSGVAANVLKNLDVDLRKIRLEVEKLVQTGPDMVTMGKLPQTPRAKNVIEYSMEEADRLSHNYVGTEHILLGLMCEQEGVAAQILLNEGLKLEQVREEITRLLISGIRSTSIPSMPTPLPSRARIEDLPDELRATVERLDVEIDRITLEKEEAVAKQEFQKAAELRDEADKLKRNKRTMLSDWTVNRTIDLSWLSANDRAVLKLALRIRDERSWGLLPTLANALEAAGCADAEMLGHCRQAGQHSDHCWVVDLLLANAEV